MAIKFLSGLNLSDVTAGSILKLDSNGNIVAATAGTDYATVSGLWSTAGQGGVNINKDVRIGTYSSDVLPEARLHVYEYQTTDPKILIEDGNTGDASMQFKISTQSYTMGIDNSDSDKFVLAASTALGTTNVLEISTTGAPAFQGDLLVNGKYYLSNLWNISAEGSSYAKFSNWVRVSNTGFYTTEDLYMDLDDSSSRFVIRGLNNTEQFIADTGTSKVSIPNWLLEANDITQTTSGDNWSSTTSVEYNQTGIKLSRSGSGYVSAAPYKFIGSFTASVSFQTTNCTHLGIIFAASESSQDNDNYGVILRNNSATGTEVRVQKRVNGGQSYPISAVNVTTDCDDGNWHELTVSYNGKHIVVDVDGTNYFNQAWTDTSFTSPGLVGVAIYDNTCQFNDFQVTETPSTTTFENLNIANGNRTLDVKLATTPPAGDVGVQFRAGSGDYLGLAAGGGTGVGLVVDSSNNVGIGTTNPSEKVEIYGNATYYSTKNTSGNVIARLGADSSGDGNFELFQSADANNRKVKFYAETGAANYINNGGKFGIGTSSPNGRVTIFDDMISSSSTTTDIAISKTSYGTINFQGANQEAGATNTKQQAITWQVNDYGSTNIDYGVQAAIAVSNNGSVGTQMGFFTSNSYSGGPSERIRITAAGLVGISNSNPSYKLDVSGTFRATGDIIASSDIISNGGGILKFIAGSNHVSGFTVYNAAQNGYLSNRITTDSHSRGWGWELTTNEANSSSGNVYFRVGYNGTVSYLNSGNFGIGTTNPGSLLSIRATTASHQLVRINRANSDTAALYLGNNSSNDAIISGNNAPISLGKDVSGTYTEYVNIATDGELKFSAYGAGILKTNASGIVSLDTNTYLTSVDVDWNDIDSINGIININSTTQIGQGDTETLVSFQNSGTERGRFEVDDSANSYFVATGFKTTGSSTGLLKSDGTIDTSTYATSSDINNFIDITDVATYLSTNNYITNSTSLDVQVGNWLSVNKGGAATTTQEAGIRWQYNGTTQYWFYTDNGNNGDLRLQAAGLTGEGDNTPRLIIPRTNKDLYLAVSGGKVGIGDTSPSQTLSVAGSISATDQISVNNKTAISVAHWSSSGSSTGAIKITIPGSHSSHYSMLVLRITAYEYNSTAHTIYYVSGHDWTSGWYNNGVTKIGNSSKNIKLGYDSNKDYVILGGVTDTWSYGHVTVDVMAHPGFYNSNMDITTGWDIRQTTDISGITTQSVTNKRVLTTSDEGSGNGIDADTVDGIQAASFLRSDANDTVSGNITFSDNAKVILGAGSDFEMFHNGSNTFLQTTTSSVGDFYITARGTNHDLYLEAADDIFLRPQGNESGIDVIGNGAVKLYYNGAVRLETTEDGIKVPGVAQLGATNFYFHDVGVGDADGLDIKWTLKNPSGNDVTAGEGATVYRLRLVTLGTGTNTGAVYICDNVDGNGWRVKKVSSVDSGSPNSNYPFVEIDGGVPKVTIQHNSTYNVRVIIEAFYGGNGGASYEMLGLDSGITNENGSVIMSLGTTTTEATSVMIDSNGVLQKRDLGSLAFNSTTLGTAASSAATDFVAVAGDTMTGNLVISNNNATGLEITGANSSYTSAVIANTGSGAATLWFDASNGDLVGSDYAWVRQNNDLSFEIGVNVSGGDMLFTEGGSERMRISSGNVGIGTTSPGEKLHVVGAIKASRTSSASENTFIYSQQTAKWGSSTYPGIIESVGNNSFLIGSSQNIPLHLARNSAIALTVGSSNNIGIGTTSPGFKLEVNGTTRLGDTATEYTRFGTYGALLSTDTHILHNMLWTGSWTQIDATKSSSTIYMGSSSNNTIKFGYTGVGNTSWSYNHTFENDGDYTAAGVIKGYGSVRVDAAATGSPYFGLYQAGSEKAFMQYADSGDNLTIQSDGKVTIRGDVQYGQGDEDGVISFNQSTAEIAKIDQEGYMYATGFKTSGTTGFLRSDGSVDTNSYANAADFLALSGGTMTGDLTIPSKIIHSGDTNTFFQFNTDEILFSTGGGSTFKVNTTNVFAYKDLIVAGGETISLGERAEGDDNGRTVLIEGVAGLTNGEGSGRIFFSEHNSTSAAADSYGLSLYYEGNGNAVLPSGFNPNTGNATWSLRRHDNSVNGTPIFFGSRSNSNVTFEGTLSVPEYIYHRGDANTYIRLLTDRIQIVAGGTAKFDSNNTYLVSGAAITVKGVTARDIVSESDRTYSLGTDANRWAVVFCETLDSAGQHESNLQDEEQPISQYETGTVLSWKDGKNRPCTQYADHMRMGIAVHGQDSPLIQGAEPVLCTGVVEEGDYLVTSDKKGHAVAVPRNIVKEQMLFDCVIGKALENGDGESHLVKTWINI